jgi:phosphoribosylformylglycinamidine synthase
MAGLAGLNELEAAGQVVLRYADEEGRPTEAYPANPNGSPGGVAGACDPTGRIFGLMPHPERFVDPLHHPRWTRRERNGTGDGLRIFQNAVAALRA